MQAMCATTLPLPRSPHPIAGLYVAVFNSCKRADNVSCRHLSYCGSRALSKTRGRRERRGRRQERRGYVAATTSAWRKEGKRRAKAASLRAGGVRVARLLAEDACARG
eukprot:scaffold35359_cov75-Phaeocystis_antarctica.AAC.1